MHKGFPPEHYLRVQEGTITPAQMLDLVANPVVLLDIGAGRLVEFISLTLRLQFGDEAFADGANLAIKDDNGNTVSEDIPDTVINSADDIYAIVKPLSSFYTSATRNSRLLLTNGGSDFTGGAGAKLHYRIVYRAHNI